VERQYVGIDLHRRRSMIVRHDHSGVELGRVRIDNDPLTLAMEIAKAGPEPEVVLEATYGWYWAADVLADAGATVHLAQPLGCAMFGLRRVKNDERDTAGLADLLRTGRLPEAWIAPPPTRELRELVRYRAKLVALRSGLKAQVHAVLAKEGVHLGVSDLFGRAGSEALDALELAPAYATRLRSLRALISAFDTHIGTMDVPIRHRLWGHRGYRAIQAIPGIAETLAAVLVAEIGDVDRFASPSRLCSWAGLTPRHHESDTTCRRGPITKQGSALVRWAVVEAAQRQHAPAKLATDFRRIATRRGRNIGRVAVARKILTLVYYGLRDGEIRCLAQHRDAACVWVGPSARARLLTWSPDPRRDRASD
jgi:transposase